MTEQFTVLALAPGGDNTLARQCLEAVKHEFGLTSTLLVAQFRREGARVLTALTMEEAVAAGERARGLGAGYRVLDGQRVVVAEEDGTGVPEPVDNHGHDHVSGEDELAREDEVEGDQQELDLEQIGRAHV